MKIVVDNRHPDSFQKMAFKVCI